MKIKIEQNCTGIGKFCWSLETGPEHIDSFSGETDTLGDAIEEIMRVKTLNDYDYYKD